MNTTNFGALIILAVESFDSTPDATVLDSAANTWVPLTKFGPVVAIGVPYTQFFYCIDPVTSAAQTFTVNGTFSSLIATAYSATHPVIFSAEAGLYDASNTSNSPGFISPLNAPCLIIASLAIGDTTSGEPTIDEGFESPPFVHIPFTAGITFGLNYTDQVQTSPTAVTPTWNFVTNTFGSSANLAVFRELVPASNWTPLDAVIGNQELGTDLSFGPLDLTNAKLVVVTFACGAGTEIQPTGGCTDTLGNTYLFLDGAATDFPLGPGMFQAQFYCILPTQGSATITLHWDPLSPDPGSPNASATAVAYGCPSSEINGPVANSFGTGGVLSANDGSADSFFPIGPGAISHNNLYILAGGLQTSTHDTDYAAADIIDADTSLVVAEFQSLAISPYKNTNTVMGVGQWCYPNFPINTALRAGVQTNIGGAIGGGIVSTFIFSYADEPPPPSPPSILGSAAGAGRFFPRCLNKTLLLTSLYRNFAGLDDVPLSYIYLTPNPYDVCLSKDCMLYNAIDRERLRCHKTPDCFAIPESKWEDVPSTFRAFNPTGAIPLPDPTLENVVVFSFEVPFGYDGVILGQFNNFTGTGFFEGNGDIVWRIRANGRYLRDCGNILFTLGSSKQLSPVYGGIQVRSGNLVEYVVSVPNASGNLPFVGTPGNNLIAGLHGYLYPRG